MLFKTLKMEKIENKSNIETNYEYNCKKANDNC